MNRACFFVFILFTAYLISCSNRYKEETNAFQGYLLENFNKKIPSDSHEYILLSQFYCAGCVQRILIDISNKLKNSNNDSITVLTYDLEKIPQNLRQKVKVLLDENARYEHVFSIANVAIVKTKNGQVVDVKIINLDDIEWQDNN